MQTVNFNCPHCGNLMAVGTNLLGRNVRCPHCKQVLRAPAAAGGVPAPPVPTPPPPVPTFNVPRPTEHPESIFGERHDEDVFGSEPPKPTLPAAPHPADSPAPVRPGAASTLEATVSMPSPPALPVPEDLLNFGTTTSLPAAADAPADYGGPTALAPTPPPRPDEDRAPRRVSVREPAPPTPAFAWIMLAYAVVATLLAGFFGYKYLTAEPAGDHPFKAMPDVLREYDPAKKRQVSFRGLPDAKLDVPPDLRVKLGDVLTVGDLEVRPTAVERKPLECTTEPEVGGPKTRSIGETLVLTLRVKNLSADTVFCPNDPAFNRAADRSQPAPYTALEIKGSFFDGIFKWPPEPGTRKEFVVGHEADETPLNPGEERDTWATVAPRGVRTSVDDVMRVVREDVKPADWLLWRVQLRRGLVQTQGPDGADMDVSATTVIGVEFRGDQIK
jgi:hypothetical protein